MKNVFYAAAVVLVLSGPTVSVAQDAMVDGEVTKIDAPAEKLTLRHGPIKNLDMDAMTMVFRVKEKGMLNGVKVGDKVKFRADRVNGQITITEMRKTK